MKQKRWKGNLSGVCAVCASKESVTDIVLGSEDGVIVVAGICKPCHMAGTHGTATR